MRTIFFLLLISITITAVGQRRGGRGNLRGNARLRHLTNVKALDVAGGISKNGYGASVGGLYYVVQNGAAHAKLRYEKGSYFKDGKLNVNRYSMDIGYSYSFLDLAGTTYLTMKGGFTGCLNQANELEGTEYGSKINFGMYLAPEVEIFIVGNVSLFINAGFYLNALKAYGHYRNFNEFGIRLNAK